MSNFILSFVHPPATDTTKTSLLVTNHIRTPDGSLGTLSEVMLPVGRTHVFLQVECLVVQQGLHHAHEVDEQRQVELHHVHLDALEDEVAEAREHLVKAGVRGQTLQRLLGINIGKLSDINDSKRMKNTGENSCK